MKLIEIKELPLPGVRVIRFGRFKDERGFFCEPYRFTDFQAHPLLQDIVLNPFVQVNESYSHSKVIRGLHFQWNPYMGKLVRTISGRMVDIVLDIRRGSPTEGKVILYDLPEDPQADSSEWIWVPPGFAHGTFFTAPSRIEYFCSGEYSPGCEAAINPFSPDLDWSLCDKALRDEFWELKDNNPLMSAKDRAGLSLSAWQADARSSHFIYGKL